MDVLNKEPYNATVKTIILIVYNMMMTIFVKEIFLYLLKYDIFLLFFLCNCIKKFYLLKDIKTIYGYIF
jgi:hypothetical protein